MRFKCSANSLVSDILGGRSQGRPCLFPTSFLLRQRLSMVSYSWKIRGISSRYTYNRSRRRWWRRVERCRLRERHWARSRGGESSTDDTRHQTNWWCTTEYWAIWTQIDPRLWLFLLSGPKNGEKTPQKISKCPLLIEQKRCNCRCYLNECQVEQDDWVGSEWNVFFALFTNNIFKWMEANLRYLGVLVKITIIRRQFSARLVPRKISCNRW